MTCRRARRKSLSELLRQIDQSDTYNSIKTMAIDLGIQLSHHMVNYFFLFTYSELQEISSWTKKVEQAFQCISLEGKVLIVTKKFISVIKLDKEMGILRQNLYQIKDRKGKSNACNSERYQHHLKFILHMALFLETAFCIPAFSGMLEKEDIMFFGRLVRGLFNDYSKEEYLKRIELKAKIDLKMRNSSLCLDLK